VFAFAIDFALAAFETVSMKMAVKFLITVGILLLGFSAIILGQTQASAGGPAQLDPPASVAADLPTAKIPAATENYVIGDDDMLSINVWKEPELTASIPVRSDGKISLPLIGEVQASGKTPAQLKDEITARLRTYLATPDVTVLVLQINSQKFNVLGRVMKPGSYSLSSTTTVLDAIAMCGGFQDFAKQKSIYILRKNSDGSVARIAFNYKAVIRGKHSEANIQLKPNDTIVVP
jgi:polysaccharide biosynthesis/export protein